MNKNLKNYILVFLKNMGIQSEGIIFQKLKGDGSKRLFWRITPLSQRPRFIAMFNPPVGDLEIRENYAYVMIGKHLWENDIPVPEIYDYNLEQGFVIMEDIGDISLEKYVSSHKDPIPIYRKVLESLFLLQMDGSKGFDTSWCFQTKRYDHIVTRQYEANYFRDAFLYLYLGLKKEWPELDAPFNYLSEKASVHGADYFLHRDFQSRNIMIYEGKIRFIDWQGGRLGPLGYDLASLIIDPYPNLSFRQRYDIYKSYLTLIREHYFHLNDSFEQSFLYLAIQRNLQILGAFSYLTKKMSKKYFESYIPVALKTLNRLLHYLKDSELLPLRNLISNIKY
ncbi:MAG TPA: phosphotransferase [Desulfobacteraceae bacterium]|nr:phosphotransferase [Desulfobacteraceae bacterium]